MGDTNREVKYYEEIQEMTLFDDSFMTLAFDDNTAAMQLMLRIIMGRNDITVSSVKTQSRRSVFTGHSVTFDIDVLDENGAQIDVEFQKSNSGAVPERARYHSSVIDTHQLPKNDDYCMLKESYVIFVTKKDVLGGGFPIYNIERVVRQTDKTFGDGSHIIYVNGAYRDTETEIGKLVHDLMCRRSDDMFYNELAECIRYYKETEEGVDEMDDVMEKIRNRENKEIIKKLIMKNCISFEEIAECVGVSEDTVKQIADEMRVPV